MKATTDGSIVPYSRASSDKNGNEISSTYVSKTGQSTINGGAINGGSIFTMTSTGTESSIRFNRKDSAGWVAGVGCGGIGDGFAIYSYTAGRSVFVVSTAGVITAGPSISGKDDNATRIRNISPRNADWSAFSTNYLMTCKE